MSSPPPKIRKNHSDFTTCIATLLWSDGEMRTRPVMFTFDKRYRLTGITTQRRKAAFQKLQEALSRNRLLPEQVVLLEGKRKYVPETPSIVEEFLGSVVLPLGCVMFTDDGNAFFDHGMSVIEKTSSARHYTYPPPVHQYISPNDNHHHGAAKQKWRAKALEEGWCENDTVESELFLLGLLTYPTPEAIKGYFDKNMFMDLKAPRPKQCLRRMIGPKMKKRKIEVFFDECQRTFRNFERTAQPLDASSQK